MKSAAEEQKREEKPHENTESDKTPGTFPGIRILPISGSNSAYVQTWQMESGGARVALNVGGDIVAVSEAVVSDEEWTRVEVTYTHPASAQTAVMYPCLQSCGKGYAYFDAV